MNKFLRHFDIETDRDGYEIELTCRLCGSGAREINTWAAYASLEHIVHLASQHYHWEHTNAQS